MRHQATHLAWADRAVLSAIEDPESSSQSRERFVEESDVVDRGAEKGTARPPAKILDSQRDARTRVLPALAAVPAGGRIPWSGPPLGAAMTAGARIMETFAHGQDAGYASGRPPAASPRLRHIAHLAVAARDYTFQQRRLSPPAEPFRVELTQADATWTWGPADAAQRGHGTDLDFALLATRRRHRRGHRRHSRRR